jgi:hypothetical protein
LIEPKETPDTLGDLNIWGISQNKMGVPYPVFCPKCRKNLTQILLSERCVIDIRIECSSCGEVVEGRNLRAELQGKIKP